MLIDSLPLSGVNTILNNVAENNELSIHVSSDVDCMTLSASTPRAQNAERTKSKDRT
jgi:hypothetical protein